MKKRILLFMVLALLAIILATVFAACNKVQEIIMKAPENISYDGQYITWDKVEADYYTVSINGEEAKRVNSTTYAYAYPGIDFDVKVTAVKGEASKSTTKSFHPLGEVEEIFVANDGTLSWEAVPGANAYQVQINGQTKETVSDTTYDKLQSGANRIKIKAIVNGDNSFYSLWSQEKRLNIYSTPINIKYDGTTLTWQGNGVSYEVIINGKTEIVKGSSYDYNSQFNDFSVVIKAVGDYINNYDSESATESFHYLDTVTDISVEDGILKWQPVDGAKGYKVKVGSNIYTVDGETCYEDLLIGKSLEISIMPYNDEGNYYSSWSEVKNVYILSTPATYWNAELDLDIEANNNFTWDAVSSAAGYTVLLTKPDGTKETQIFSANSRSYAQFYEMIGIYTVQVKANAPSDNADYYDSKYSQPITVERLAAPKATSQNFIVSNPMNIKQGFTVNFIGVSGATGYQLWKDGVMLSGRTAGASAASISDNNVINDTVTTEQHYTYIVQTLGGVKTVGGKKYVTLNSIKSTSLSFDITVLPMPTGLNMAGFNAQWDAVGDSNGYGVSYGGNSFTALTESYNLETLNSGTYNVCVCAKGNGSQVLASNYTATLEIRRLAYPQNIRITYGDGNGLLGYDDVPNSYNGYSVYIDGNNQALDEQAWGSMYNFISETGTVLSMTANANTYNEDNTIYYMTSPASPTQQFIRLAAPTFPEGALSTQTELRWNAPDNVNLSEYTPTYVLSFSDTTVAANNGTSYNISDFEAGQYVFTVRAVGDNVHFLDSDYSYVGKSCLKLDTPVVTVENDGYHWNAVDKEATAYYLEIDGVRVYDIAHKAGQEYIYKPTFTTIGAHIVSLKAIGNGIDTVSSNAYTFTQNVEQLQRPQISTEYSSESFVLGGTINVSIETPIPPHAISYQYEIAGRSNISEQLNFSQVIDSPGTFTIRVKAVGGVIDDEGIFYIDSLYSTQETMILLASPTVSSFEMTAGGYIQWKIVSNALGYDYYIIADNQPILGTEQSPIHGQSSVKVDNFRQFKSIQIYVRTSGNGSNVINSEWISWTWTNSQYQE